MIEYFSHLNAWLRDLKVAMVAKYPGQKAPNTSVAAAYPGTLSFSWTLYAPFLCNSCKLIQRITRGHADDLRSNFPSDAHSNLDAVEIDRSLIRDVSGSEAATGLADAIIAIGKSLGLTVVAQGVETGEQAGFLAHTLAMSCKASIF